MIRSGRETFYTEAVDLTKVEKTLPDGSCGTLLAEKDDEVVSLAHEFLVDIVNVREVAQAKISKELIHKFMKLIFQKVAKKINEQPFEKYHVVSVTSSDKEAIDVENLYGLVTNTDVEFFIDEINDRCQDIGVKVEYIKSEKWGSGNFYIPVGIRFID